MATSKTVDQLTLTTSLTASDVLFVSQNLSSKKTTASQLAEWILKQSQYGFLSPAIIATDTTISTLTAIKTVYRINTTLAARALTLPYVGVSEGTTVVVVNVGTSGNHLATVNYASGSSLTVPQGQSRILQWLNGGWVEYTTQYINVLNEAISGNGIAINSILHLNAMLYSAVAQGTAPFNVTSTTLCTNLNADLLRGYYPGNNSGNIPLANGTVCTNLNASLLQGYTPSITAQAGYIPVYDGSAKLVGDLTGNAASADKWKTARTLTITGDGSGSASIDGSGDVSLALTAAAIAALPVGAEIDWPGMNIPTGWLEEDGSSLLRTSYTALFGVLCPSQSCTMTIATPCVVTAAGHGLVTGQCVSFETTVSLPSGVGVGINYWVTVIDANTFKISTSRALQQAENYLTTSGTQSGSHTLRKSVWGIQDNTHFSLPDKRGITTVGAGTQAKASDWNWGGTISNHYGILAVYVEDQGQGHWHKIGYDTTAGSSVTMYGSGAAYTNTPTTIQPGREYPAARAYAMVSDQVNGDPRIGKITRMAHVGVKKIIRYN